MRDRFILGSVVALTIACMASAVTIAVVGPASPAPYSQQLLTLMSTLAMAGFYTVLGLLSGNGSQRPSRGRSGRKEGGDKSNDPPPQ